MPAATEAALFAGRRVRAHGSGPLRLLWLVASHLRKTMGDSEFDDAGPKELRYRSMRRSRTRNECRGARNARQVGWGALTPTELEVALLVGEDSATRRSVSVYLSRRGPCTSLDPRSIPAGLSSVFNSRSKLRAGANQNEGRRGHSQGCQPATKVTWPLGTRCGDMGYREVRGCRW